MSIKIMADVWRNSKATGSALLVLLAIADFANDDGTSYPSISTLAAKARMSVRNARYVIDNLVQAGELVVKRSAGPKGCNLFKVGAAILAGVQSLQGAKIAGVQSVQAATGFPEGVQPASLGAAIAIAPEPSVNHQGTVIYARGSRKSHVTKDEPAGFAECWGTYPARSGGNNRQEAADAYRARLKEGADPAALLAGVKRYATFCDATETTGTQYVKQARTFFGPKQHWTESWTLPTTRKKAATDVGLASIDYAAELPGSRS